MDQILSLTSWMINLIRQCIKIINILFMLGNQNSDTKNDFTPVCHKAFFRLKEPDRYVQINTCKSFSKSNEKKLKLINDSKSLQKSAEIHQKMRKIRPMKVKISRMKNSESTNQCICSIKEFKAKINRITQQSIVKTQPKCSTQQTDISESIQTTRQTTCVSIQPSQYPISSQHIKDPFPTLAGSLVVHQGFFNPQSLLQSKQNSVPSHQVSLFQSSAHQEFELTKRLINFRTPIKDRSVKQEKELSTREKTEKKQRLTLNMARKVQTHQTLKTQNDVCHSVVEENEYKNFFDNLAFPDYFSPKFWAKENTKKSGLSQNFSSAFDQARRD